MFAVSRRVLLGSVGVAAGAGVLGSACSSAESPSRKGANVTVTEYGSDPSQVGQLFRPSGPSRGVVVVIHGGFWRASYDASLGEPLARELADRGWTAWNLEYRRVVDGGGAGDGSGGGVPATLDDISTGIDALADLDVDTSTVVTLGHSAGGHLAVWAAGRHRQARWRSARVPVTHAISQAGVVDLAAAVAARLGDGATEDFLGAGPADAGLDAALALADPVRQLPLEVPVWCVHARDDATVPFEQSQSYVDLAVAAGADAELVEVTGGHFGVIDVESTAWLRILEVLEGIG